MVATALLVATAWIALPGGGDAAAATVSSVSVTTGLSDGQVVHVSATGVPTGTTYLAVECGPEAITLYTGGWPNGDVNPEDGCEGQQSTVLFSGQTDAVSGSLRLRARLSAPVGPIDCTVEACFVAFFSLAGARRSSSRTSASRLTRAHHPGRARPASSQASVAARPRRPQHRLRHRPRSLRRLPVTRP